MAAKLFKRSQVAKIGEALNAIVPKQDDEISAREAVALLAKDVRGALARGISLATIAQRIGVSERYLRGTLKTLDRHEEPTPSREDVDAPFTELARLEPAPSGERGTPSDPDVA